ncbi:hypothetical protein X993_5054 [Burkholderia pseudomallei K42]|nr:hypothetical protein X993_5054 [Burkholderia pseudomallei K42]
MARSCADAARVRAASRRPPFSRATFCSCDRFALARSARLPTRRVLQPTIDSVRARASNRARLTCAWPEAAPTPRACAPPVAGRHSPARPFAVATASRSPAQRACRRGACCNRRSIASALRRAIALVSRARGPKSGRRRACAPPAAMPRARPGGLGTLRARRLAMRADAALRSHGRRQACSTDAASRAITCSSSVGTTSTATRLPLRLTVSALRAFACASSSTPSQRSRSHTAARVCG